MSTSEWRDGFLFLGGRLALDFVNTKPVIDGSPQELLADVKAFVRWLVAARLVAQEEAKRLQRRWAGEEQSLETLRQFRESLRKALLQIEEGVTVSTGFVQHLNALLKEFPIHEQLVIDDGGRPKRTQYFHPQRPSDVFGPLASDTVGILTSADSSRLRKCQSCVLHFYDVSKKGTRVWCSMNLCGNRAKVAAYAERKRSAQAER